METGNPRERAAQMDRRIVEQPDRMIAKYELGLAQMAPLRAVNARQCP